MNEDKKEKKKGGLPDAIPPKVKKRDMFFQNFAEANISDVIVYKVDKIENGKKITINIDFDKLTGIIGDISTQREGEKTYKLKRRKTSAKGIVLEYQEVK